MIPAARERSVRDEVSVSGAWNHGPFGINVFGLSLDLEGAEAFRGFGVHGDAFDHGEAGAAARPVDQAADLVGGSLEDRLHPAVGQVPGCGRPPCTRSFVPGSPAYRSPALWPSLPGPRDSWC